MATTRNYTARIRHNQEEGELLEQNFNNWQKLYAVAFNNIATMLGAYYPLGENTHKQLPKLPKDSKEVFNTFENPLQVFKTINTFLHWLPAEKLTPENKDYAVNWHQAIDYFEDNWDEYKFGPIQTNVLYALPSLKLKDGVSIINRRQKFLDSGLSPTKIQKYFLSSYALPSNKPYTGALNDLDSYSVWRTLISYNFGTSTKGDPGWDDDAIIALDQLCQQYNDEDNLTNEETLSFLNIQGIKLDELTSNGAPPAWKRCIKEPSFKVKRLKGLLESRIKKVSANKVKSSWKKLDSEYRDFFIKPIEDLNLVPFEKNNEYYYAAYAIPFGQLMSYRSNALQRIAKHTFLYDSNTKLCQEVTPEIVLLDDFCTQMTVRHNLDRTYSIREHQDNGLETFVNKVNKGAELEEALEAVRNELEARALRDGNRALLIFLYENKDFGLDPQRLKNAVKYHFQKEMIYEKSSVGYVADVRKNPLKPQYGVSKPPSIIMPGKKWRANPKKYWKNKKAGFDESAPYVAFGLISDKGLLKAQKFNIDCARAEREFLFQSKENAPEVLRNTRHHNPNYNREAEPQVGIDNDVATVKKKNKKKKNNFERYARSEMCISPFKKGNAHNNQEYWSIGISFSMEVPKPNKDNKKTMGVDLGWRIPATYAILDQDMLHPEENGILKWKFDSSIFSDNIGEATDKLRIILEKLDSEMDVTGNLNFATAIQRICGILKRKIRGSKDVSPEINDTILDYVKSTVYEVSPYFVSKKFVEYKDRQNKTQGKLSYRRMEMLESLKKLLSTLISVAEKNNYALNSHYEHIRTRITDKITNLRVERSRIVARMILDKAIESGVGYISIEDLKVKADITKKKFLNRGNARWCVRRIVENILSEAPCHGIQVKEINPKISSHQDVDGQKVPRLVKINPQKISETSPKNSNIPSISSLSRNLKSYLDNPKGETGSIYKDAANKFLNGKTLKEIIEEEKAKGTTSLFVPKRGAEWIDSKILGKEKSDIIAAQIMAQRCCERLHGKKKPATARKKKSVVS